MYTFSLNSMSWQQTGNGALGTGSLEVDGQWVLVEVQEMSRNVTEASGNGKVYVVDVFMADGDPDNAETEVWPANEKLSANVTIDGLSRVSFPELGNLVMA